ncbi:hypothetical protein Goe20_00750 [Bacillus phage vB_BsuM-Goe20]|nr:hypothetical protein BSP14_065 [Bacillus phage BSP14]WCS68938.1 hypothetical protein Goe17_00790 [Bacillus phage vB_BsuM-Goe17]WCS69192.1 hypothetical protein Goe20_00750 [Bacillus phage vB_BsuM-Goe20]
MAKKKDVKSAEVEATNNEEVVDTKAASKPLKPYVHIDTFLKTAIPMFGMSRVQAAGFKAKMIGKQYQRDEQIFVDELKAYLNIK